MDVRKCHDLMTDNGHFESRSAKKNEASRKQQVDVCLVGVYYFRRQKRHQIKRAMNEPFRKGHDGNMIWEWVSDPSDPA